MELIRNTKQKERALDILTRCFYKSSGMTWMFKTGVNRLKALRRLTDYCVREARAYNGAFITSDQNGVILFFRIRDINTTPGLIFERIKLTLMVTGFINGIRAARLKKMIERIRPKKGWCGWLLASDPDEDGCAAAFEIKREIYQRADEENMPIFAETTSDRIKVLYERMGFYEYHWMKHPYADCLIYFMRRDPGTGIK